MRVLENREAVARAVLVLSALLSFLDLAFGSGQS
jgi:hypothetical protein